MDTNLFRTMCTCTQENAVPVCRNGSNRALTLALCGCARYLVEDSQTYTYTVTLIYYDHNHLTSICTLNNNFIENTKRPFLELNMPFSQFSASPEHSQSGSQSQNQPTRAASTSGGKKGRKSRVASVAASPAVSSSDLLPGSSSVHWQTSLEDDLGASGSRAGTPSKQQRITGDEADEFPLLPQDLGSIRLSVIPGAARGGGGVDDDAEPDEDNLPDMADDDYSAQLSWQSQSKDNLKYALTTFWTCSIYFTMLRSLSEFSWTTSVRNNTIVMRPIDAMLYQNKLFDVCVCEVPLCFSSFPFALLDNLSN